MDRYLHAREQMFRAMIALLPEKRSPGWTRAERQRWFDLMTFLVDWFYVIEEATLSLSGGAAAGERAAAGGTGGVGGDHIG